MIQVTDEYRAIAKEYKKVFGYGVPLSMIPPTTEMPDLIENIEKCIAEKKDSLLEIYGIKIEEGDLF